MSSKSSWFDSGEQPPVPEGAHCFICLQEATPGDGGLVRDCACRGDYGYGHVSCIAKFKWRETEAELAKPKHKRGCLHLIWRICSNCNQGYKNTVALSLADEFVKKVDSMGLPDEDDRSISAALSKALALALNRRVTEAQELYEHILQTLDKSSMSDELNDALVIRAECVGSLSSLAYNRKDYKEYVRYLNMQLSVYEYEAARGRDVGIVIEATKIKIEEGKALIANNGVLDASTRAEYLTKVVNELEKGDWKGTPMHQELYIGRLFDLSSALTESGKGTEGYNMARKALKEAQQLLGPDHTLTREIRSNTPSSEVFARTISNNGNLDGKRVQVLRYVNVKAGPPLKLVVRTVTDDEPKTFKALPSQLVLDPGTQILCFGLETAVHLNEEKGIVGIFNKAKGRYVVHLGGTRYHKECLIKPDNLAVIFIKEEDIMRYIRTIEGKEVGP